MPEHKFPTIGCQGDIKDKLDILCPEVMSASGWLSQSMYCLYIVCAHVLVNQFLYSYSKSGRNAGSRSVSTTYWAASFCECCRHHWYGVPSGPSLEMPPIESSCGFGLVVVRVWGDACFPNVRESSAGHSEYSLTSHVVCWSIVTSRIDSLFLVDDSVQF